MTREQILLIQLAEECAEVSQNISKALRFGKDEVYYKRDDSNAERITSEMNDLIGVFRMLVDEGILPDTDEEKISNKKHKVDEYIGYSTTLGIVK